MTQGRQRKRVDQVKGHLTNDEKTHRKEHELLLKSDCKKLTPPTWLSKKAKTEFTRVFKGLSKLDFVSDMDLSMLSIYADAYTKFGELTQEINENGIVTKKLDGEERVSPYVLAQQKYIETIMKCSSKLGLSVSDRLKLIIPKSNDTVDEFDDI